MSATDPIPLVGVSSCVKQLSGVPFHAAGEKYITAVVDGAACQPLLIPSLGPANSLETLLDGLDGLLLTGSPSNVAPHHYGGPPPRDGVALDPRRDATTLGLIGAALERGLPLFCICRGFQELNVALGGSLHQHLEEQPDRFDHRQDPAAPMAEQYAPRHGVAFAQGGRLAAITGVKETRVNSLHGQGVDRLAPGLAVEATAPDGTIEAVSVGAAKSFALAVQWHPEWRVRENPVSLAIFRAFGDACRAHMEKKRADHGLYGSVA